jgi:K+/H+ antiporter YhaU regulatory subunit KhtT
VRSATIALFEVLRRADDKTTDDPVIADLLHGLGCVDPVRLTPSSPAVGQTLAKIDLRAKTGATVLAIVRGHTNIGTPTGRETLEAGDVLALAGPSTAVDEARTLLLGESD